MAGKRRALISIGGPALQDSTWADSGLSFNFAAFTNTSTATILGFYIVPQPTLPPESIPFGSAIQRLLGAQIAIVSTGTSGGMAAFTGSTLGIAVYRNFGTLGTQIANAGGAITSLTIGGSGINTALVEDQVFSLTIAAGTTSQVYTGAGVPVVGAKSIGVDSITPSATYAVGTPLVGQVGSNIAFGWAGTPAFRQNASVVMPAVTANGALNTTGDPYGPFLPLQPGDVVALYGVSTGSDSILAGVVNLMIL